jgi:hypothetical protein
MGTHYLGRWGDPGDPGTRVTEGPQALGWELGLQVCVWQMAASPGPLLLSGVPTRTLLSSPQPQISLMTSPPSLPICLSTFYRDQWSPNPVTPAWNHSCTIPLNFPGLSEILSTSWPLVPCPSQFLPLY